MSNYLRMARKGKNFPLPPGEYCDMKFVDIPWSLKGVMVLMEDMGNKKVYFLASEDDAWREIKL